MTSVRRCLLVFAGMASAVLLASWSVYIRRTQERVVSSEALDDPAIAQAFGRISRLPQMGAMRWLVAQHAVRLRRTGEAVDLGCGAGYLVIKLAEVAPELRVTGIDLSDELLLEAATRAHGSTVRDRVAFRKGDVARIPFPDGSLDLVVSTLSLHHWWQPVAVLDEIARALRPGGSFLVVDLRRDLSAPLYMLLWFATHFVVPRALRWVNEPLGSRNASFTPEEAAQLAQRSRLTGWRVTQGPLWLTIEGTLG